MYGAPGDSNPITKSLTIQGAGADQTFIDAGGSGPVLSISASVNLLGLTIQNGLSSSGGTFIQSGITVITVTIESCVIRQLCRQSSLNSIDSVEIHGGYRRRQAWIVYITFPS
jgi:hypothetical protein